MKRTRLLALTGLVSATVMVSSCAPNTGGGTTTPTNAAPVAAISTNTTTGPAPLTVDFSGSGSFDPEGTALTYLWDFGDGTATATTEDVTHTYNAANTYTVTLTV